MSIQKSVISVFCLTAIVPMAACSAQSPVAPATTGAPTVTTTADGGAGAQTAGRGGTSQPAADGIYEIVFLKEATSAPWGLQSVVDNTLNVGEYLVLSARVTDASGVPAQQGRITYEYCSLNNVKVTSAECHSGQGRWKRLWSMPVDPVGSRYGFGSCSTPRTIGFRLRYDGDGDIADGVSPAKDVTWQ